MTQLVVIDDERTFTAAGLAVVAKVDAVTSVTHIRNSDDALLFLAKQLVGFTMKYADPIVLFLDHDLGGNDTIEPVVNFISVVSENDNPCGIEACYIHSQNPASHRFGGYLSGMISTVKIIDLPEMETP